MRPTGWLRRRLTRVATGGRLDEAPRTLEEAARAGVAVVVARPLTVGRVGGGLVALLFATVFWAGLDAPVRAVLEALMPGWVDSGDGDGRPLLVGAVVAAATIVAWVGAARAGAAAVEAWDARRIGRGALTLRLALAPAAIILGLALSVVAGAIAGGADRDGGPFFAAGTVLAVPSLLVAAGLPALDAWVRTLLLVRLRPRRGPPAA